MSYKNIFRRVETKFIIDEEQRDKLKELFKRYMREDSYGKSDICNIYFDTPTFLLIRRSVEKPVYKEKLRLRSYGVAASDSDVFIEIKKKYKSVVYKRRISKKLCDAVKYLEDKNKSSDSQVGREIDYMFTYYKDLSPKVFLSYKREAFYASDDSDFRITFDTDIVWRDYDLSLDKGIYGQRLLEKDKVLLEVKSSGGMPMWLISFLSENKIYKTSFSKYGNAYLNITDSKEHKIYYKGDLFYASNNI